MKEKEIEQLFSDGLGNLEGDVNPNAWANIEKGLQSPADPTPAITSAAKGGGLFSSTGFLLTVAAAGIITAVYFGTKKSGNDAGQPLASTEVVKEAPVIVSSSTDVSVSTEIQTSNNSAQKPASSSTAKQNAAPSVKKNAVPETKQAVHSNVPVTTGTPSTSHQETQPASTSSSNNNSNTQPAATPAQETDNSKKSDASTETKKAAPSPDNSNTPNFEPEKPKLKIFMPTGFRPDVDPAFGISGEDVKEFIMTIYDSRGNIVFISSESNQTWDGKLKNGEVAPAGKYKVAGQVIDNSGATHPKNGSLTIER